MDASPKTRWQVIGAAAVSVAGLVTGTPSVALAASLAAALLVSPRSSGRARTLAPFPWRARTWRFATDGRTDGRHTAVFMAFGRSDPSSRASAPDAEPRADAPGEGSSEADEDRGSRSYREFAAGLDEESEEISFLPPYASGAEGGDDEGTAGNGDRGSLLIGDLAPPEDGPSKLPVPRRFALGTVAIIRKLLEPADVERILLEQRRYPRLRFGDVAIQLGLLTEEELQELLIAQERGVFADEEISDARRRLAAYHGGR